MLEHFRNKRRSISPVPEEDQSQIEHQEEQKKHIFHNKMSKASDIVGLGIGLAERLLVDYAIYKRIEQASHFLIKHPVFALPICALTITLGIPLFTFAIFACISTTITFFGFVFLEGAVLTVAGILLGCFLILIFAIFLMVIIVISIAYFGLQKVHIID